MQQDAWRTYLELALGLTEKPRKRAKQVIDAVSAQRGASVEQVRAMTEELVATSVANREAISRMVRGELDRALGVVGLATAEEIADLRDRVARLEERVGAAESGSSVPTAGAGTAAAATAPVRKAAKKTAATKTAATPAKKTAAKKTATKKTAAKKSTAKKAGTTSTAGDTTGA